VARNRKRAKERRARRPQAVAYRTEHEEPRGALGEREDRPPLDDLDHDEALTEHDDRDRPAELEHEDELGPGEEDETPGPMVHAAPDAELADLQLALGRSELDRETEVGPEDRSETEFESESQSESELEDEYETGAEDELDEGEALDLDAAGGRGGEAGFDGELASGRRGELVASAGAIAHRRALPRNRVINFLVGSWRELQRVQWPDRRQVMQATGVVIGFVIVAGVFLGVADFLAGKLVDYILK
jgi:preprotein translocase subunit SecE